jgi:hypothetical protein
MSPRDESKRPVRVLIFPCGAEIGLEIHRALSWSTRAVPVGASSVADNHGPFVFQEYVDGLPYAGEAGLIDALNRVIAERRIDYLFPAHDSIVLELAENRGRLACPVVGSPVETCRICRNKALTLRYFESHIDIPAVYDAADPELPFPLFAKPAVGQGSQGTSLIHSRRALDAAMEKTPELLLLEALPGPEYTVDCFSDRHGALRFAGARERRRVMNGISVSTAPVDPAPFRPMAEAIHEMLELRGAWFFQAMRAEDGRLALLEIAPRVSGGMGLFRNLGVNLPLLALFDAMDEDVAVFPNDFGIEMDRALFNRFRLDFSYRHLYIDFDDTLICGGRLHPPALMLVAQCRARDIRVHLLSRHAGDLDAALERFGIRGLFDEIVHLDRETCKSACIEERDAVFVDDSFAERRRVQEAAGIPVFAPDAIEALLDWRC